MTIEEALTSTVNFPLPLNTVKKALIDASLDGSAAYDSTQAKAVDLCMGGLLLTLLTSADISEDDVSVKLPSRDVLLRLYSMIRKRWGMVDELASEKPTVKQVRFW